MKKITSTFTAFLIMLCICANVSAAQLFYDGDWHEHNDGIKIKVSGKQVALSVDPFILDGSTLVPARAMFAEIGAAVEWLPESRQVLVSYNDKKILIRIDSTMATVDGRDFHMPIPAKIVNDFTMIPLRFVAEQMEYNVGWNEDTRTISLDDPAQPPQTPDPELPPVPSKTPQPTAPTATPQQSALPTLTPEPTAAPTPTKKPEVARVVGTSYEKTANGARVLIVADSAVAKYNYFELDSNPRIVVDVYTSVLADSVRDKKVNDDMLAGIRSAQFSESENITRVVVDLVDKSKFSIWQSDDKKTIGVDVVKSPSQTPTPPAQTPLPTLQPITQPTKPPAQSPAPTATPKPPSEVVVPGVVSGVSYQTAKLTLKGGNSSASISQAVAVNKYTIKVFGAPYGSGTVAVNDEYISTVVVVPSTELAETSVTITVKSGVLPSTVVDKVSGDIITVFAANSLAVTEKLSENAKDKLVVLDAGHGGKDPGASGVINGMTIDEKNVTLDIATMVNKMLGDAGVKTQMTHAEDAFVELHQIPRIANSKNADLFVSIHANSNDDEVPNGTETHYGYQEVRDGQSISSLQVAQIVQAELANNLDTKDRKTKHSPRLIVLKEANMPAILVETAFMSNKSDMAKLNSVEFRRRVAKSIANGIIKALNKSAG